MIPTTTKAKPTRDRPEQGDGFPRARAYRTLHLPAPVRHDLDELCAAMRREQGVHVTLGQAAAHAIRETLRRRAAQ